MREARVHRLTELTAALRESRGFSFVSVLLALLILAVLYFGYFHLQSATNERTTKIQGLEAAKAVACRTQREQLERDVQMYAADHDGPPHSLDDLARAGIPIPSCPEGGHYALVGTHVTCSVHR
jgi:competence protein ComGC